MDYVGCVEDTRLSDLPGATIFKPLNSGSLIRGNILRKSIAVALSILIAWAAMPACIGSNGIAPSTASLPSDRSMGNNLEPSASMKKVNVLTTIAIFADMVRQVVGDRATVKSLIPGGSDPHTFQPTPQDVRIIAESDVVFLNGMGLEGAIADLIHSASRRETRIVVLSEGLSTLRSKGDRRAVDDETHAEGNPHLWLDVQMAMKYVERVRQAMIEVDPLGRQVYESNASRYLEELAELDLWIAQQIDTIPEGNRKLVTFHDAFPYYAMRYGLRTVGIVVRSPGREPSAREIADLVETLKRENVRTVFAEPQFSAKLLQLAANEAGLEIATLYSDTVDESVKTYVAMMRFNTEQIVTGLR